MFAINFTRKSFGFCVFNVKKKGFSYDLFWFFSFSGLEGRRNEIIFSVVGLFYVT